MRRILIGHDGSARGDDALALGRALAAASPGAETHVATVYEQLSPKSGLDDERPAQRRLRRAAEETLRGARERWPALEPSALHAICANTPAEGLHRIAGTLAADVIVVGASHRGPLGRIWPGSATDRVVHDAPCAVAVAPPGFAGSGGAAPGRIGVAVNGSGEARDALAAAAKLAADAAAELVLVTVVDPRPLAPAVRDYAGRVRELHGRAERLLEEAAATLPSGVAAIRQCREGEPVDELLDATRDVDLLVLGTRDRGPVGRLLLGSVSAPVVRGAACPVLVVPRGAHAGDADARRAEARRSVPAERPSATAIERENRMNRILIGYDGSERGEDALALGRALARLADDPHVVVATVHPALIPRNAQGEPTLRELRLRDEAADVLEGARGRWPELPEEAFRTVRGSSPAAGLHRLAREEEIDVIVVGASHRHGLGRIWHGSATEQTLQGSPRPVAVAPPGYAAAHGEEAPMARVGLAYDGSREAAHALGLVGALVAGTPASVVVIDVVESVPMSVADAYGDALFGAELRERADADLARAREELVALGVADVEVERLEGAPAALLVEASERLDLLALGSRNHGPALRLLLGTVSARVVRDARSPVLVFPRSAATELDLAHGDPGVAATSR